MNNTIENEYTAKTKDVEDKLSKIKSLLGEHYAKSNGQIDWGHIRDLGAASEQLAHIIDFLSADDN
ncbi:MAG: hypothetical protein GY938_03870 [Ketobacter sp.]|nr:hypothetical protein [Ketobacter sp.]